MSGLRLERLTKRFGSVVAVDDVTLEVPTGAFVTLLGPSGCGKTTTLRLIAGFEAPSAGAILLSGQSIEQLPANRREMALVFQNYALFPHLNVFENVAYGLRVRRVPGTELRTRVDEALAMMGLEKLAERSPSQLSGGQQQRVALARAMVIRPRVLLFDEPLSNLDAKLRIQMRDEIRRLQRRLNITAIYVTHDQSEAMALSDQIVVMNQGRVEQVGPPTEIYARPATTFVADFIGRANFFPAELVSRANGNLLVRSLETTLTVPASPQTEPVQPGALLQLVVRPEALSLSEDGPGWHAIVQRATYLGAQVEYEVTLYDRNVLVVDNDPLRRGLRAEGDRVRVAISQGAVHALPV